MLRLALPVLMIAEVIAFVALIFSIGFFATLGLWVVSLVCGLLLLRHQGLKTLEIFVSRLEFGHAPMQDSWDGVCLMVAGGLLIFPGIISDVIALLLLIPQVRVLLYRIVAKEGDYRFDEEAMARSRVTIIEADYQDVTDLQEQGADRGAHSSYQNHS